MNNNKNIKNNKNQRKEYKVGAPRAPYIAPAPKAKAVQKIYQKPVRNIKTIHPNRGLARAKSHDQHNMKNVSGTYHKLEKPLNNPKLAFALGNVAGGRIKTPWAENAATSDTPTQLLAGTKSFNQTVGANTDYYTIVTICPWGSYAYNGGSPFSIMNTAAPGTAMVLANLLGQTSMTDMFGTFSYSDRLVPFAASAHVTVEAPAANLSGTVYVGSIQIASINEGSVIKPSDLISRATGSYSLTEKATYDIRAGITNTAGIHQDATTTSLNGTKEEWASYLIFHNVARNITDGSLSNFTITVNLQANAIVAPDGSQPAIQGLVREVVDVPRFISPNRNSLDEQNAECLARMNHSPELPSQWAKIVYLIKTGASIAGLVETGLSCLVPIAQMAATLLLVDSSPDDPLKGRVSNRVRDTHNNVEWHLNKISQLRSEPDLPESVVIPLQIAIEQLEIAFNASGDLINLYDDYVSCVSVAKTVERWDQGRKVVDHVDEDGNLITWSKWKTSRMIMPKKDCDDSLEHQDRDFRDQSDSFHGSLNPKSQDLSFNKPGRTVDIRR